MLLIVMLLGSLILAVFLCVPVSLMSGRPKTKYPTQR
jgi:hypothetical protein